MADREYYDLLGVDPHASTEEIKRAYKKMAMKHHPDKNPNDPLAAQTFQELQNAYSTLLDPDSRAAYDRYGSDYSSARRPSGMDMDAEDLFSQFFSFNMGGPSSGGFYSAGPSGGRRGKRRGDDSVVPYEVTLEDLYNGKTVHFSLERNVICGHCNGTGGKAKAKPQKCTKCDGKGATPVTRALPRGQIGVSYATCSDCHGDGKRFKEKERCKKCKGDRTVKEKKAVDVNIEKGMSHNQKIVLKGEADQQPDVETGDVIFTLKLQPHETMHRTGSDLLTTVHITLSEAILGFSRIILTHLDGRGIHVERKRGQVVNPGETILVKGEGMPVFDERTKRTAASKGDLYVHFEIEMPNEDWLKTVDVKALEAVLPPKKPDLESPPAVVDTVRWETADADAFIDGMHGDDWEDEDDDEGEGYGYDDDDDMGAPPECTHQ